MSPRRGWLLPLALLLATGCVGGPRGGVAPARTLAQRIDSILDAPPLHRTSWGVLVHDDSGRVVYARNAERHFIPASNTKLVVTAVALGTLGPEWRYRTPVLVRSLSGDSAVAELRVVGTGDPTFSARFWQRPHGAVDAMAATIAAAGIKRIHRLSVDAGRFTDPPVNSTWEVGDLPGTSAPPTGAFAIDEGTFRLLVSGGAAVCDTGSVAPLVPLAVPGLGAPQPVHAVIATDTARSRTQSSTDYTARRDTIYLAARVAAGRTDTLRLAMTDAPGYAARALGQALGARGVRVDTIVVLRTAAADTAGMWRMGEFESPPVADIVAAILRPSQNWIAEQLLKTLGAELGTGGSWTAGLAVERRYLVDRVGIDSLAFSLRDASGLSAQNLFTPAATVRLLEHTRAAPWSASYRRALAAPDVPGSTLAGRLEGLAGRLRGKTGTISNVNALSGFLQTDSGRELTFAIMSNGSGLPSASMRAAIDSTVTLLARTVR